MEFFSWVVYFLSFIIFFFIGYYLLNYILVADFELKNKSSICIFCMTFGLSLNSLLMIIFEIIKLGSD